MREADAVRQDIRPLRIGLLNLMPNKIKTETQIARLLGATPLQVELTLVKMTNHVARNTPSEHIISFYRDWEDIRRRGSTASSSPARRSRRCPFEQVTYWDELRRVFDWTQTHVHSCFNICWGAQAAVHHFHGMPKYQLRREGVRRLPPSQSRAGLTLSAGLLGRFLDPGVALDRGAARGHPGGQRHERSDGVGRGGPVPAGRSGPPVAAHVQPYRI